MNTFTNTGKFKAFLKDNVKSKVFSFDAYLKDLETQYNNTASAHYELSSLETKSGKPVEFDYEVNSALNEDGDCDMEFVF